MNSGQLKRAKRRIRREVLALRDAIEATERARLSGLAAERVLALPSVLEAGTVMVFWSFGSEIDTSGLIDGLFVRDVHVALPRIAGSELQAHSWRRGEPLEATEFGAMEPARGEQLDPSSIDVTVVPAVAFDRAGRRVGYGGGFYDRFLPRTRADAARVGLGFGIQLIDGPLPGGRFDLPVHVVITDRETIVTGAEGGERA